MSEQWNADATLAVCSLAATNRQFTIDEVWEWLTWHSTAGDPEDNKALGGIITTLSRRLALIDPQYTWMTSVRKTDRPIRVWIGTGRSHPTITPTEDDIVGALAAIESVAQRRSHILHEQVRASRRLAPITAAV